MKNRVLNYLCSILLCIVPARFAIAQNYKVIDIRQDVYDLSARTSPRFASDGTACALIKVCMPSAKYVMFDEAVGAVDYFPGMYGVYVPAHTTEINYSMDGGQVKGAINLNDYNISVQGMDVYKVTMQYAGSSLPKGGLVHITSNVSGAVVCLDNIPVGQTPVSLSGVTDGTHTISVLNTLGYDTADCDVQVVNGIANVHLELVETPMNNIDLQWCTPGGDSSGWYWNIYKKITNNGKIGLTDLAGKMLVPCEFDGLYPDIQNGFFVVQKDGKEGLYEPGSGIVVPCQYDAIVTSGYEEVPSFYVTNNGKCGYINRQGKVVIPLQFDAASRFADPETGLIIIVKSGQYGVYDQYGKVIVPYRPAVQCDFSDGVSVGYYGKHPDKRYFIMDKYGNETMLPDVKYIDGFDRVEFKQGRLAVKGENEKWGYIDKNGKLIVPFIYDHVADYSGGCARVANFQNDGSLLCKYIDLNGNTVFDDLLVSRDTRSMFEDILMARFNLTMKDLRRSKLIYGELTQINGPLNGRYNDADFLLRVPVSDLSTGYFIIFDGNRFGLADNEGNPKLACEYDRIQVLPFYNGAGAIIASKDEENYIFDMELNYMFSLPSNITIWDIKDGIVQIYDEDSRTFGYMDEEGNMLCDCVCSANGIEYFLQGHSISEGKAMLVIGDRFGFIDSKGEIVVPVKYSGAIPFNNGKCYVKDDNGNWECLSVSD